MARPLVTELRKFVAPEFIFGVDSRKLVGRYAHNFAAKTILVVSDRGVQAAGWTAETVANLQEAGLATVLFTELSANPRDHEVEKGADLFRSTGCDALVAVGGGSVIDCAKGIGICVSNGGTIHDYEGVDRVPVPMPPLICLPTTGGSSADVSQFAIITNTSERYKMAIISKAVVPDISLVDPTMLRTMDTYLTACTGLDALVHAIEAYVSNAHSPITDLHALEAIRLLSASLVPALKAPHDTTLRTSLMLGSLQAGLAFSNASLGSVHAMSHSLGGYLDLPHGECNALLLPHLVDYNFASAPERFHTIGEQLGCELTGLTQTQAKFRLIETVLELQSACGILPGLRSRGISVGDVGHLASKAINDPCNATNPRRPNRHDLAALYQESL